MIVLAVLILAAAIALIVVVVLEGGGSVRVEAFDFDISTTVWGVFVAGAVTTLIALGGLVVLAIGIRQVHGRRREIEYLRKRLAEQEPASTGDVLDENFSTQSTSQPTPTTQVASTWVPDQGFGLRGRPVDL